MDIKDAKRELTQIRIEMRKQLVDFEEKTGLKVEGVGLVRVTELRGSSVLVDVEIEVKL